MPDPKEHKGIACPHCGIVGKYSTGQMKKTTDCITRPHTCKNCGTVFTTVQVPVGIVTVANNHLTT